nr:unnamed protein product [Callosobruchus analis]
MNERSFVEGRLECKKGNLIRQEESVKFKGNEKLPAVLWDLETPYQFFNYTFDEGRIKIIVEQSNLFSGESTPNHPICLKESGIKRYIGICTLMSVIHMPNIRKCYLKSIHYVTTYIIDHLLNRYQSGPYEACLSTDEQLCPTKMKNYLKQNMPAKPQKRGFKVYVMTGVSSYSYNFEIYSGQENKTGNI